MPMRNDPQLTAKREHDPSTVPGVLLLEDDHEMRAFLADSLRTAGYDVVECPDAYHLLDFYLNNSVGHRAPGNVRVVISDVRMPGIDGLELLEARRRSDPNLPTILITAFGDEHVHRKAAELGAVAFLDKPFEIDDLLRVVAEVVGDDKPASDDAGGWDLS